MNCPKCGSTKIKRSHSRSFQERLRKLFNQRPYRCIDCNWRGILETKAKSSRTKRYTKKYILTHLIIIIIIIIGIYLIISYLDSIDPPPNQDSAGIYAETLAYKELSNNLNLKT